MPPSQTCQQCKLANYNKDPMIFWAIEMRPLFLIVVCVCFVVYVCSVYMLYVYLAHLLDMYAVCWFDCIYIGIGAYGYVWSSWGKFHHIFGSCS